MTEPASPDHYGRLARTTLLVTPLGAALGFGLAALLGAELWVCVLLAGVMTIGCLGAAALIRLRGASAAGDAGWIALVLRLLSR